MIESQLALLWLLFALPGVVGQGSWSSDSASWESELESESSGSWADDEVESDSSASGSWETAAAGALSEQQALLGFAGSELEGWSSESHPCDPHSFASTAMGWLGVRCDTVNGHVTQLAVPAAAALSGDIAFLSALSQLQVLDLSGSGVRGDIGELATLEQLSRLTLDDTSVSGDIGALANCTQLSRLSLQSTRVFGSIGRLHALTRLSRLNLMGCAAVRGDIAALPSDRLTQIFLRGTNVTGNIGSLCAVHVDLESTRVYGNIEALANCTPLSQLKVQHTAVYGRVHVLRALHWLSDWSDFSACSNHTCSGTSALVLGADSIVGTDDCACCAGALQWARNDTTAQCSACDPVANARNVSCVALRDSRATCYDGCTHVDNRDSATSDVCQCAADPIPEPEFEPSYWVASDSASWSADKAATEDTYDDVSASSSWLGEQGSTHTHQPEPEPEASDSASWNDDRAVESGSNSWSTEAVNEETYDDMSASSSWMGDQGRIEPTYTAFSDSASWNDDNAVESGSSSWSTDAVKEDTHDDVSEPAVGQTVTASVVVGAVVRDLEAFKTQIALASSLDTAAVRITAFEQKVQLRARVAGTRASFESASAIWQFRLGVAVALAVDPLAVSNLTIADGRRRQLLQAPAMAAMAADDWRNARRLQGASSVVISYDVTVQDHVTAAAVARATTNTTAFAQNLVEAVNNSGDLMLLDAEHIVVDVAAIGTTIQYEVVVKATDALSASEVTARLQDRVVVAAALSSATGVTIDASEVSARATTDADHSEGLTELPKDEDDAGQPFSSHSAAGNYVIVGAVVLLFLLYFSVAPRCHSSSTAGKTGSNSAQQGDQPETLSLATSATDAELYLSIARRCHLISAAETSGTGPTEYELFVLPLIKFDSHFATETHDFTQYASFSSHSSDSVVTMRLMS